MKIAVECYPDEVVMRAVGVPGKQLLHEARKGEVINWLKKNTGAVGMVDEDPDSSQPRDLSNYQQIDFAEGLRLLVRRGSSCQKLIVVCPRLEEWLYLRAKSSDIQPEKYGLPANSDHLHSIPRYEKKDGFLRFLEELMAKDKGMRLLRQWISGNAT
jgi:hypothetical protein